MATRAKFIVAEKKEMLNQGSSMYSVSLNPVTGGSDENKSFWKYTPGGKIELSVIEEETANQFQIGKFFYVDFTEATD